MKPSNFINVVSNYQDDTKLFKSPHLSPKIPNQTKLKSMPEDQKYGFRKEFAISSLPLLLWGLPVPEFLVKWDREHPSSTLTWLKCLLFQRPWPVCILNAFLLLYSLYINGIFFKNLGQILYGLLIDGALGPNGFLNLHIFYNLLPIIIPLNYCWFYGFVLQRLLQSNLNSKKPIKWIKFLLIYGLIGVIHTIQNFLHDFTPDHPGSSLFYNIQYWHSFTKDFFLTFFIPIYVNLCDFLQFQLKSLNKIIQKMANESEFTRKNLQIIKRGFIKIADTILLFNQHFSIYLSLVILYLLIGIFKDFIIIILRITLSLFSSSNSGNSFNFIQLYNKLIQDLFIQIFGLKFPDNETTEPPTTQNPSIIINEGNNATDTTMLDPIIVQRSVWGLVGILLKSGLIFWGIWSAVKVNDEGKAIHVHLNHLASVNPLKTGDGKEIQGNYFGEGDPELEKLHETHRVYQMYRSLKAYIHSRMEQPKPVLLQILILNLFPPLKRRLYGYELIRN